MVPPTASRWQNQRPPFSVNGTKCDSCYAKPTHFPCPFVQQHPSLYHSYSMAHNCNPKKSITKVGFGLKHLCLLLPRILRLKLMFLNVMVFDPEQKQGICRTVAVFLHYSTSTPGGGCVSSIPSRTLTGPASSTLQLPCATNGSPTTVYRSPLGFYHKPDSQWVVLL